MYGLTHGEKFLERHTMEYIPVGTSFPQIMHSWIQAVAVMLLLTILLGSILFVASLLSV